MALKVSRRERSILVVTVVVAFVAIVYHFILPRFQGLFGGQIEGLKQASDTYWSYVKDRAREPAVNKRFEQLEKTYRINHDQGSAEFTKTIEEEIPKLGLVPPKIGKAAEETMEDNEDYGYTTLTFQSEGNAQALTQLLVFLDQQAILVKDLSVKSRLDSDRLDISVTVRQVVKLSEETKKKRAKKASASGKGGTRSRESVPVEL
ncbi:hypothetical protein FJY63_06610 [Candidatus Sumerlaeota bacterium]|nr:hypothetical protein [Candidatus Sumerlaeota bacterium]